MPPPTRADEKEASLAQWPSPWPYDFPVEGDAKTPKDKAARVAGISEVQAPIRFTRREAFFATLAGWGAFATAGGADVAAAHIIGIAHRGDADD